MRLFRGRWGFAGGWAIDLFLGAVTRPHADIDIAILRDDQRALHPLLDGAQAMKVVDGHLTPWFPGDDLQLPIHEVHATWPDGYHLEFLLNEQDRLTGEWVFRRDPRIRRPLDRVFLRSRNFNSLAPEIALLYKSKSPGPKDDSDLCAAARCLPAEQRTWLIESLATTAPGHPWIAILAAES